MRFDDRFSTVMRDRRPAGAGAVTQWRQLLDLLAQRPAAGQADVAVSALRQLRALHDAVPVAERAAAVAALNGRLQSRALVRFLSSDRGPVAAAAIRSARLADPEWAALIPGLPVPARAILRDRSDIGAAARALLDQLRAADQALPSPVDIVPAASEPDVPAQQLAGPAPISEEPIIRTPPAAPPPISALVERIEEFRAARQRGDAPLLPFDEPEAVLPWIGTIGIETDDGGVIRTVDGAPRGSLYGQNIARSLHRDAAQRDDGEKIATDRAGARAFDRRLPLRAMRLVLSDATALAGEWRLDADPWFDDESGRFRGYRGVLRRPMPGETPVSQQDAGLADPAAIDVRELVHELRTPLGAIIGFAEIIEQQLLGPVAQQYRAMAAAILDDGQRLLAGFDDLDLAARADNRQLALVGDSDGAGDQASAAALLNRLAAQLGGLTNQQKVILDLRLIEPIRPFALSMAALDRVTARLVSAIILAAAPGECLDGSVRTMFGQQPANVLELQLPARLAALDDAALFDGSVDTVGEGPLLGLGFSFRLVRSLARHAGGQLDRHGDRLLLRLPCALTPELAEAE